MSNQQLTTKDRSLRTALQAVASMAVGLVVTVWNVDGVPTAVIDYLSSQLVLFFGVTGVTGGILGYLMNRRK